MNKRMIYSAVFGALPVAGWAQTGSASQGEIVIADSYTRPIIVVGTRAPQYSRDIGQSLTQITADTLETRQTVALSDILTTTPGITSVRAGGLGSATSLFIRGASSEHTLVVIDGVRVNDPSTPAGSYDFGTLFASNVARVDVLRGADSVPWGSGAMGGVVNVTTLAPTRTLGGQMSAEAGSYGTTNLNASLTDTLGPLGVALGGGWLHSDGISAFAASEGGKERDGTDQKLLNTRATLRLSNAFSLEASGRYTRSRLSQDGFNNPTYTFGDDSEYTLSRNISGSMGAHLNLLNGNWKNTLRYTLSDTKRDTYDAQGTYDFTGVPGFEFGYHGQVQRVEYQGDARVSRVVRLAFGAEHEASQMTTAADIYGDPAATYRTAVDSAYAQAIVTPTYRLTLTGGMRYDHHRVYGGHSSFAANAVWRVIDNTTLRASYAEGFRAPSLSEIYGDGGTYTVVNPKLRPELATSMDMGIEQRVFNDRLHITLTAYQRVTKDLIQYGYAPSNACTSGYCGINLNVARARADGVEAQVAVQPIKALSLSLNATHGRSFNETTGLRLLRRPDDSLAFNVDGKIGLVKLVGTVQRVSSSFDTDSISYARVQLAGYTLVSGRVALSIGDHLELYGRIENAFDAQYQVIKHYGTYGRTFTAGVRVKL